MGKTQNHSGTHSTVMFGATTRVMGLVATAAALVVMLSMGMTKAGATEVTYPPCTSGACVSTTIIVIPGGGDDDIIESGEPVEFIFEGFEPGTEVTFTISVDTDGDGIVDETFILTAIADEDGTATFEWDSPAGTSSGDYEFTAEGIDDETGEPRVAEGTITIEAKGAFVPGDGGDGGPLPYTGSNSTNLVRIGLVLIVAGGISVVAVRRRNAHAGA